MLCRPEGRGVSAQPSEGGGQGRGRGAWERGSRDREDPGLGGAGGRETRYGGREAGGKLR